MADHSSRRPAVANVNPGAHDRVADRLQWAWPWLLLGVTAVIAGGLVSAVVAHDPSEKPVWASAYLVLVVGVAQIGLVLGRALLPPTAPVWRAAALEFVVFACGNASVLLGTLVGAVWLVDVGGALLVIALAMMVWGVRSSAGPTPEDRSPWMPRLLWCYRLLAGVLLVSIPVGLLLARV